MAGEDLSKSKLWQDEDESIEGTLVDESEAEARSPLSSRAFLVTPTDTDSRGAGHHCFFIFNWL